MTHDLFHKLQNPHAFPPFNDQRSPNRQQRWHLSGHSNTLALWSTTGKVSHMSYVKIPMGSCEPFTVTRSKQRHAACTCAVHHRRMQPQVSISLTPEWRSQRRPGWWMGEVNIEKDIKKKTKKNAMCSQSAKKMVWRDAQGIRPSKRKQKLTAVFCEVLAPDGRGVCETRWT